MSIVSLWLRSATICAMALCASIAHGGERIRLDLLKAERDFACSRPVLVAASIDVMRNLGWIPAHIDGPTALNPQAVVHVDGFIRMDDGSMIILRMRETTNGTNCVVELSSPNELDQGEREKVVAAVLNGIKERIESA